MLKITTMYLLLFFEWHIVYKNLKLVQSSVVNPILRVQTDCRSQDKQKILILVHLPKPTLLLNGRIILLHSGVFHDLSFSWLSWCVIQTAFMRFHSGDIMMLHSASFHDVLFKWHSLSFIIIHSCGFHDLTFVYLSWFSLRWISRCFIQPYFMMHHSASFHDFSFRWFSWFSYSQLSGCFIQVAFIHSGGSFTCFI